MTSTLSTVSNIMGCLSFVFDFYTYLDGRASDLQNEFKGELGSLKGVLRLLDREPGIFQVSPVVDILRTEVTKCMEEIDSFQKNMDSWSRRRRLRGLLLGTLRKNTLAFSQKIERQKSFFTLTLMIAIAEWLNRPAHITAEEKNPHQNIKNIEHTSPSIPRDGGATRTDPDAYKPVPTVAGGVCGCKKHEQMQKGTRWGLSQCRLLQKCRGRRTQNGKSKKQHSNRSHPYVCDSCEAKRDIPPPYAH